MRPPVSCKASVLMFVGVLTSACVSVCALQRVCVCVCEFVFYAGRPLFPSPQLLWIDDHVV